MPHSRLLRSAIISVNPWFRYQLLVRKVIVPNTSGPMNVDVRPATDRNPQNSAILSGGVNCIIMLRLTACAPDSEKPVKKPTTKNHVIEVGEKLKEVVKRFLASGMTMDDVSKRMDVSMPDLETLLGS